VKFLRGARIALGVLFLIALVNIGIVVANGLPPFWIAIAQEGLYEWEAIIVIWILWTAWRERHEIRRHAGRLRSPEGKSP
jgi:hypothetical protein